MCVELQIPDLAISMLAHLTWLGSIHAQRKTLSNPKVQKVTKKKEKRKCVHLVLFLGVAP